jgi:hypothetical protein
MSVSPIFTDTLFFYPATLTSTGVTDGFLVADADNASATDVVFQVTVSSIGTNVVIRLEGSLDGVNYFNLDSLGDTTITANGTTGYSVQNCPLKWVRGRLVSISGGTPSVKFVMSAR